MSPIATKSNPPDVFERFVSVMDRLIRLLGTRACPKGDLYFRFAHRVAEIRTEILAVAALLAAGAIPPSPVAKPRRKSRASSSRSTATARVRPIKPAAKPDPLPDEIGWLAKLLAHEVTIFGGALYELIQESQMQALLAAAPHLGDRFREIFLASGWLKDAEAFLPPPCSARFRRHLATIRAQQKAEAEATAAMVAAYEAAMAEAAAPPPPPPPPEPAPERPLKHHFFPHAGTMDFTPTDPGPTMQERVNTWLDRRRRFGL